MWYSQWAYLEQVYSKVNSCKLKEFSINFLKSLCECVIVISWNQWFMKIGILIQKWFHLIIMINTLLHMFTQLLFWAGNQGNHKNFNPSLQLKKLWLIFMGMKQKKIKMADSKFFRWYFEKFKTPKFYSEIIWPLARKGRNFYDYPGFQPKTTPA